MFTLGALLICAALLGLAALTLVFRRPDPPRWTTMSWPSDLIAIGLVCIFALGVGYLSAGAISAYEQGVQILDLGLLAAVLVVALMMWRKLDVRARLRAMEAGSEAAWPVAQRADLGPGVLAATQEMPVTTAEPPPSGPAHRAA